MTEESQHHSHSGAHHTPEQYVEAQRKAGLSDNEIMSKMIQAGWDHNDVTALLSGDVPPPPSGSPSHNYSQTGNTGVPIQVENVQYNMKVKPVESKIGTYLRLTMLGLWFSVAAICSLLAGIINKVGNEFYDVGPVVVFAIALACVSVPVFIIANQRRDKEMKRDQRLVDDLFYKRRIRNSLVTAVVIGGILAFSVIYQILAKLFLHGTGSVNGIFSTLVFLAGVAGILAFVWPLHAKTQR